MKYLVTWTGVTSGSFLGRDDGYPEEKLALVDESRLYVYKNNKNVKVFAITEVNTTQLIEDSVRKVREAALQEKQAKEAALAKLSKNERRLLRLE